MPELLYPGAAGGSLVLTSQPSLARPSAGVAISSMRYAGFDVPRLLAPDGQPFADTSILRRGTLYAIEPADVGIAGVPTSANGGTVSGYNTGTLLGTGLTHPALTIPGTPVTGSRRTVSTTAAVAGQIAGLFHTGALRQVACRSATPYVGGWFSEHRAAPGAASSIVNGTFYFNGIASAYGLNDCFGVGWFTTDVGATVYIKSRTGAALTSIALDGTLAHPETGALFPALTRSIVRDGKILASTGCLPGSLDWVGLRVFDELTGTLYYEGRITPAMANLPTAGVGLGQDAECGNGAVAAVVSLSDWGRRIYAYPGAREAA